MSRLFVLGNAGFDVTLTMGRMPAPGETLVANGIARAPGGKGLNQAVTAARAGVEVIFAAAVGRDAEAGWVTEALGREPLHFRALSLDVPTDVSFIMVTQDGENSIVTAGAAAAGFPIEVAARFAAEVGPRDWLLLQGNLSLAATTAAMRAAKGRIILNTAPLLWPVKTLLPLCHLVIANAVEAESITGKMAEAAARALLGAGSAAAIVTLGGAGAVLAVSGASGVVQVSRAPAQRTRVVDTAGAGDTLCGVLAAALVWGLPLRTALGHAQRAAALTVVQPGAFASLPKADDLHRILADDRSEQG